MLEKSKHKLGPFLSASAWRACSGSCAQVLATVSAFEGGEIERERGRWAEEERKRREWRETGVSSSTSMKGNEYRELESVCECVNVCEPECRFECAGVWT